MTGIVREPQRSASNLAHSLTANLLNAVPHPKHCPVTCHQLVNATDAVGLAVDSPRWHMFLLSSAWQQRC